MKKRLLLFLTTGILVLGVTGCIGGTSTSDKNDGIDKSKTTFVIIDEVTENQLPCDEKLEKFYEDENYVYEWSCIKDNYMIVKYENGSTKLVSEALKDGSIKIADLDKNNIKYYKQAK